MLVLAVVIISMFDGSYAAFNPVDNYLIACGSSRNVTFHGRVFVPDSQQSSFVLKSQGDTAIVTSNSNSNSNVPSLIFQSARIFPAITSYKFDIHQQGRHWVRLYFFPLPNSGNDLESAPITVVTDKFVLINNFTSRIIMVLICLRTIP
ncbi:Receptor-like protein kinase theseus [Thalictrum thalictroides]|uniref:Receptor-like protein kinase theseus n=1 Tax=Thalictrum thalictroides TaxID=46969 RepID=A0A7J6WI56_THATH|nr:Receptor-like protein kinase theseus [Thalictrum thalictroides]